MRHLNSDDRSRYVVMMFLFGDSRTHHFGTCCFAFWCIRPMQTGQPTCMNNSPYLNSRPLYSNAYKHELVNVPQNMGDMAPTKEEVDMTPLPSGISDATPDQMWGGSSSSLSFDSGGGTTSSVPAPSSTLPNLDGLRQSSNSMMSGKNSAAPNFNLGMIGSSVGSSSSSSSSSSGTTGAQMSDPFGDLMKGSGNSSVSTSDPFASMAAPKETKPSFGIQKRSKKDRKKRTIHKTPELGSQPCSFWQRWRYFGC